MFFFVLFLQSFATQNCSYDSNLVYTLALDDSRNGVTVRSTATNAKYCVNGECTTTIQLLRANHVYNLSLYSQNTLGTSEVSYAPLFIGMYTAVVANQLDY